MKKMLIEKHIFNIAIFTYGVSPMTIIHALGLNGYCFRKIKFWALLFSNV